VRFVDESHHGWPPAGSHKSAQLMLFHFGTRSGLTCQAKKTPQRLPSPRTAHGRPAPSLRNGGDIGELVRRGHGDSTGRASVRTEHRSFPGTGKSDLQ
jgi:hypothetical protein